MNMILRFFFRGLTCFFLILISSSLLAQNKGQSENYWFLGPKVGLEFNQENQQPDTIRNSIADSLGIGQTAIFTDHGSGKLMFAANPGGVYFPDNTSLIFDKAGNIDATSQVAILAAPLRIDTFLVFFIQKPEDKVYFHMIYEEQIVPTSSVPNFVETGSQPQASSITILPDGDGENFYLLTSNKDGSHRLVHISSAGIDWGYIDATFKAGIVANNFAFDANSNRIAVAPIGDSINIQLWTLEPENDTVLYDTTLLNTGTKGGIYDVSFSPDGSKLYYSALGKGGVNENIYQVDFDNPLAAPSQVIPDGVSNSYSLKLGPDGSLYHTYLAAPDIKLGKIATPNDPLPDLEYERIFLETSFQGKDFPVFVEPYKIEYDSLDFKGPSTICNNTPTLFVSNIVPAPDSVVWYAQQLGGDTIIPNLSNSIHATITIQSDPDPVNNKYTLYLVAYKNGFPDTVSNDFILDRGVDMQVTKDTTICPGDVITLERIMPEGALPAGYSLEWNGPKAHFAGLPPQTTDQLTNVSAPGTYWLTALGGTCPILVSTKVTIYGKDRSVTNKWVFGNKAGLDFTDEIPSDDNSPPFPITSAINAANGVTAISDLNGELIFYSDGKTLYDENGDIKAIDLGGDTNAIQPVLTIPVPENDHLYFIFTNDAANGPGRLTYSIYNFAGDSLSFKNTQLLGNTTGRMAAAKGEKGFWLMTHDYGTNAFRAFSIDNDGIDKPIITNIGETHDSPEKTQGVMKFSNDGEVLAVAFHNGENNFVELFDFDTETGKLNNNVLIKVDDNVALNQAYGIGFSPQNKKLYVSTSGTSGAIYEFEIDTILSMPGIDKVITSSKDTIAQGKDFGAIQIGPDGQMYVAVNKSNFLDRITVNESNAASLWDENAVELAMGTMSLLGLPSFVQNIFEGLGALDITVTNTCASPTDPVLLSVTPSSDIDRFRWTIKNLDDNSSPALMNANSQEASFITLQEDRFRVSVNVTNVCGLDTLLADTVQIYGVPEPFNVQGSICNSIETVNIQAPSDEAGFVYTWPHDPGNNSNQAAFDKEGIYQITVTNLNGCSRDRFVTIGNSTPPIDLGSDKAFCLSDIASQPALDAGTNLVREWYYDGNPVGLTGQYFKIDTLSEGTHEIIAEVSGSCVKMDKIFITVNPAPPLIKISPVAQPGCNMPTGRLDAFFSTDANGSYTLVDYLKNSSSVSNKMPFSSTYTNLLAGIYSFKLIDNLTGCSSDSSIVLSTEGLDIQNLSTTNACVGINDGTITARVATGIKLSYEIAKIGSETVVDSISSPTTSLVNYSNLPNGKYNLLLWNQSNGCTADTTFTIGSNNNKVNITLIGFSDPKLPQVICSPTNSYNQMFSISGGIAPYTYSIGTILGNSPVNKRSIVTDESTIEQVFEEQGLYYIKVTPLIIVLDESTIDIEQVCPDSIPFTLNIHQNPLAEINGDTSRCSEPIQLTATQVNGASYSWILGGRVVSTTANFNHSQNVMNEPLSLSVSTGGGRCKTTTNTGISIAEPIEVDIVTDEVACTDGKDALLRATVLRSGIDISGTKGLTYTWAQDTSVIEDYNAPTLTIKGDELDGFTAHLTVLDENAICRTQSLYPFVRKKDTRISIPPLSSLCPLETGDPYFLRDDSPSRDTIVVEILNALESPNIFQYEWLKDGNAYSTSNTVYLDASSDIGSVFTLMATNTEGCVAYGDLVVVRDCPVKLITPNVFSPQSSNGRNRNFTLIRPRPDYYNSFEIFIFSKWGELIFRSQDPDFQWDGTQYGGDVPTGNYVYIVRYSSKDKPGELVESSGNVTLLR